MKIKKITGFCLIMSLFTAGRIFAQDFGFDEPEITGEKNPYLSSVEAAAFLRVLGLIRRTVTARSETSGAAQRRISFRFSI